MTIDIEKLIADIDEDGSGEIEYDEFRNLLSSATGCPPTKDNRQKEDVSPSV